MSNIDKFRGKEVSLDDLDSKLPVGDHKQEVPTPPQAVRRGRLIFAMDATASREDTWDMAMGIQIEMFQATEALGGIDISLCYYRGDECKASAFMQKTAALKSAMQSIRCQAGPTQIRRVIDHAVKSAAAGKIHAVIFIGDTFEEEHHEADILNACYDLQKHKIPVFMFHDKGGSVGFTTFASMMGNARNSYAVEHEKMVELFYRKVADITNGKYLTFDRTSAQKIKDLLGGVAVLVAAGREALEDYAKKHKAAEVLLLGKS